MTMDGTSNWISLLKPFYCLVHCNRERNGNHIIYFHSTVMNDKFWTSRSHLSCITESKIKQENKFIYRKHCFTCDEPPTFQKNEQQWNALIFWLQRNNLLLRLLSYLRNKKGQELSMNFILYSCRIEKFHLNLEWLLKWMETHNAVVMIDFNA